GLEALTLLPDPAFDPFTWFFDDLTWVAIFEGDGEAAAAYAREGAAHPADANRGRFCTAHLPWALALAGKMEEARACADECLTKTQAAGVPGPIALACLGRGLGYASSDGATAVAAFQRGRGVGGGSGNRLWEGLISIELANLQATSGEPQQAL